MTVFFLHVQNDWKTVDDPAKSAWNNDATRNEFYYAANGEALPDFNLKEEAVQVCMVLLLCINFSCTPTL